MGNSLRCCLACVLPCGALDLIRIVHLNGYVEEPTGPVTAGEFLKSYPNYVLSKPSSQGVVRKILILSPKTELKRGSIYFLIPQSSLPSDHRRRDNHSGSKKSLISSGDKKENQISKSSDSGNDCRQNATIKKSGSGEMELGVEYLSTLDHKNVDVKTKTKAKSNSGHRRRRSSRGKSGVWQPQLERITEDL